MRPTDENQHGSTRPNLFSGARRRFSEDDNLLARLERDSARQASGSRSRVAWYVAAASLVLLLLVVVGYMAYENANIVRVLPVAQPPIGPDAAIAATAAARRGDNAAMPDPQSNLPVQHNAPSHAEAPTVARADAGPVPPLVLLQAHDVDSVKPAPPEGLAVAPRPVMQLTVPAPAPVQKIVKPVLAALLPAAPPPVSSRVASTTAPRAAVAARTRKSAPARAMEETPVDTDVALLSAIIIHASSHADERAQRESSAACARGAEKHCPGGPSAQQ